MKRAHAHAVFVHGDSVVHRLPAHVKILALVGIVVSVVATPREQTWAFAVEAGLVGVAAVAARIRPSVIGARFAIAIPLLVMAGALPFVGGGPRESVGGLALSVEGLWAAWAIVAKGLVCLAASLIVTATTPVPDLLSGLARLRTPALITGIAGFMVRYTDIVAEESTRMRTAMAARGYEPRWLWQARPAAGAAGLLFVRAYERGERTYDAMLSRGYSGAMPRLDSRATPSRDWWAAATIPCAVLIVALAAIVAGGGPVP